MNPSPGSRYTRPRGWPFFSVLVTSEVAFPAVTSLPLGCNESLRELESKEFLEQMYGLVLELESSDGELDPPDAIIPKFIGPLEVLVIDRVVEGFCQGTIALPLSTVIQTHITPRPDMPFSHPLGQKCSCLRRQPTARC